MPRHLFTSTILGAFLWAGLLLSPVTADGSNKPTSATVNQSDNTTVRIEDTTPFTRLAYIPAGYDVGTLRFERVRMVRVPSKIRYTTDNNCEEPAYQEPGGSSGCTHAQTESPVTAYEVTYSYAGEPMASDEYSDRYFTLHVYFRPDELDAAVRQAASAKKQDRADTSGYFAVSTYREPVPRVVIDESRSTFCEGSYVDGNWVHRDANCVDNISYKTITAPSDYITVRVDPIPSARRQVGIASASLKPSSK
jgi:hypothetical protein